MHCLRSCCGSAGSAPCLWLSPEAFCITFQVSEEELRKEFEAFGEVSGVKPCHKGGYGFVTFKEHAAAVQAIVGMNGKELKGKVW